MVRERYWAFGPTLAAEKLAERHEITIGRETLRQWKILGRGLIDSRPAKSSPPPGLAGDGFGWLPVSWRAWRSSAGRVPRSARAAPYRKPFVIWSSGGEETRRVLPRRQRHRIDHSGAR